MADAPILSPLNLVADLDAAGDFERKHTPDIRIEAGDGGTVMATVELGRHVPHPNQADHYFQWIELQVDSIPIARFDLSPVATDPHVCIRVRLDPGTTLRAVACCNLHGTWAAETVV